VPYHQIRVPEMPFDPEQHRRRSIRLKDYDYSWPGAYFVTVCAFQRKRLFGEVVDEEVRLSPLGGIVGDCWSEIPRHFDSVSLDTFVIMPNHIHGIVVIEDADLRTWRAEGRGTACRAPTVERFAKPTANSLPTIIRSFKSAVTRRINAFRGVSGSAIWQRNYYEHIVRNEEDLSEARQYIADNPSQWAFDRENPARVERAQLAEKANANSRR